MKIFDRTHQVPSFENDPQLDIEVDVTLNNTVIYNCTFSKLIEHWRSIWYTRTNFMTDPTFHFGFVQVSSV
jgi:hypothetical protein